MSVPEARTSNPNHEASSVLPRYAGEVTFIYAFDLGYEMKPEPIQRLLGQQMAQFAADMSKPAPRQPFFYRPQMVQLPPLERIGPSGLVRVLRTVKLFPAGVVSLTIRVPFEVSRLVDLVPYHNLNLSNHSVHEEARQLAEELRLELLPHLIRPVPHLGAAEAYTVFCLQAPPRASDAPRFDAEAWLKAEHRTVAALLTEEPDMAWLSNQEAEESTSRYLSYYGCDLVVLDWDAALLVDEPRNFEEILHVIELANVQIEELAAYDRILDEVLERSYRDLGQRGLRSKRDVLRELREFRIDMTRFSDELSNITKFFGDWHLARLYQSLSARFHLADWHRSIDEKLKTLDDLYQLHKQDQNNRLMLILEAMIVVMFILDLIVLVVGFAK